MKLDSWLHTGSRILNQINNPPKSKFSLDSYYIEQLTNIKNEIEILLKYEISIERLHLIIAAWNYQFIIIETCSRYDLPNLRMNIQQLIEHLREAEKLQNELRVILDILSPVTQHCGKFNVFSIDQHNLTLLKRIERSLIQSRGGVASELTFTKRAYFEIFFIAESLGLHKPLNPHYISNDLISFARIITKPSNPTQKTLRRYHQSYMHSKQKDTKLASQIETLINKCHQYKSNDEEWSKTLAEFQDKICPFLITAK